MKSQTLVPLLYPVTGVSRERPPTLIGHGKPRGSNPSLSSFLWPETRNPRVNNLYPLLVYSQKFWGIKPPCRLSSEPDGNPMGSKPPHRFLSTPDGSPTVSKSHVHSLLPRTGVLGHQNPHVVSLLSRTGTRENQSPSSSLFFLRREPWEIKPPPSSSLCLE